MKLPGVISLRKLLPIWPMPNGGFDRPEMCLEHHVELTRFGPPARLAGFRVADVGQPVGRRMAVLGLVPLDEVVCAVALVGDQRLDQRIVEHLDMARRHPHLTGQDDRRVDANNIVAAGHHRMPPLPLDVLFEVDAQRPVVPGRLCAAIDFTRREHKPTALCQVDNGIDNGRHGSPA
jgi:hypothetical protein